MINNVINILSPNRKYYEKYYFYKYHTLDFYKERLLNFLQKETLYTEVPILKGNDFCLQDDINSVLENITKKPKARFKNKEIDNLEVLLYKYISGNQKIKQEMHFYKRKLFYFNYIFSYIGEEDKKAIIQTLKKKYLNTKKFNHASYKIVDEIKNSIIIVDDVEFSINYISSNNSFYRDILHLMVTKENNTNNENNHFFNHFLDKL